MKMKKLFRHLCAFTTLAPILLVLASPAQAQGMISAPTPIEETLGADLAALKGIDAQKTGTLQRLLRRLGYLSDADVTREVDDTTVAALEKHLAEVKLQGKNMNYDQVLRSLFSSVWTKENWASGTVNGQELVVDVNEVRALQDTMKNLGYEPGPVDGTFGPASYSAIENFQQDNGMKVTGLPTRNVTQNIQRGLAFLSKAPTSTIHLLNWPDYINPDLLSQFEKETGIRVIIELFDTSSETKELLLAGSDQYDVIVQPGYQMRGIVDAGDFITTLDKSKLPNAAGIDPAALKITDTLDPGNLHSVPYMWGTVGIGINETITGKIRPDLKKSSMASFLDPAIAADLSKCGIGMVDEAPDVMSSLVAYTGGDPGNITTSDLEAVDQIVSKVAPYIQIIPSENYSDLLARGKLCVVMGYYGGVSLASGKAKESGIGKVSYQVPAEGSQLWFDLMVIPKHAKDPEAAYKLINFLMKPESAAANTNFLHHANAIMAAKPMIDPVLLKDPGMYPPASVWKRLAVLPPLTANVEQEIKRVWEKLRKK
jgi:putrescine transport system substrate-binding protein